MRELRISTKKTQESTKQKAQSQRIQYSNYIEKLNSEEFK